jgi:UDPglucose 6-dehydrogenase
VKRLRGNGAKIIVYEPLLKENVFSGCSVIRELKEFKEKSDIIIANRYAEELYDCIYKVYTRDIYGKD